LLLLALALPGHGRANVEFVTVVGEVRLERPSAQSPARPGERVDGAFALRTGPHAEAQLRFDDGTLLTVLPDSALSVAAGGAPVDLRHGGLDLIAGQGYRVVRHGPTSLRSNGFVKLRVCAEGCREATGLYGRPLSGEVIVEYAGGRTVMRNRPFRVPSDGKRPITLTREPDLFADTQRLQRAAQVKAKLAEELRLGMEAFKTGDYEQARARLHGVAEQSPSEHVVSYTLGLIALEMKDNAGALRHFQQYSQAAPEAARDRGVNQMITLLLSNQLEQEVRQALLLESALSSAPPEPNTIAVQPFANRSDPSYNVLAKGIAAMVITDLSKVPGLKVLERQMVQRLLDEIRLSESGVVDQDSQVRAGRLMRAEKVIVGGFGVE